MARTLSPAKQCTIAAAAILCIFLIAERAAPERPRQDSDSFDDVKSSIRIKPIDSQVQTAAAVEVPSTSRPRATSFRNPFSAELDPTQGEFMLLPGPRNRWQTSAPRHNEPQPLTPTPRNVPKPTSTAATDSAPSVVRLSPPSNKVNPTDAALPLVSEVEVKSAILSVGANVPVDTKRDPSDSRLPLLSDEPELSQQPAPKIVEQPPRRLSAPRSKKQGNAPFGAELAADWEQSAIRIAPTASSEVKPAGLEQSHRDDRIRTSSSLNAREENAYTEPAIISDFDGTPSSWLVEAQAMARGAQSLDELLKVCRLCERVTGAQPDGKLAPIAEKLSAWAHNRRGELLVEADQPADALPEFQAAIDLDPQNSLAIHNRAVTLAQQNNFDAALADFNRVIELNPGLAIAYRNRAELLAAQGKVAESIADYTHAIEGMPEDAELYRARAHAFQQVEEFERALGDLNRSIQIAPKAAEGYAQRGNLLADRCDYVGALEDFEQSLAIAPQQADAHRGLAWIKSTCPDERLRDALQGLTAARKAVELSSPGDYLTLEVLAAAHANAGEFDEAIAVQRHAISAATSEAAPRMRARLNLYEQRQPYRAGR